MITINKPNSTLSAVFRKTYLEKAGLMESKMVNDTCIYLYGSIFGDTFIINKGVAAYRIHGSNISSSTFSRKFIVDCLDTKLEIFNLANDLNLIKDKRNWLDNQLAKSIKYFIYSSKNKAKTFYDCVMWCLGNRPSLLLVIIIDKIKHR